MELNKAISELRALKERKFDQTFDLIVNLKGMDFRKTNLSFVVSVPNKVKEKTVCAFLNEKSDIVPTITKPEFARYNDKLAMKNLVKKYDFFIAHASLMPSVASSFGKVLGPTGKMPSPQLGVMMKDNAEEIKNTLVKISKSAKIRVKEANVKIAVGKLSMADDKVIENIKSIYEGIVQALPLKVDNVKNVLIKLTMTKPIEVQVK
ncbi:MAG: ribosomal L1 domain-containing protein [Nanoarchaeota archaeon]|mgnify:FL=1